MFWALNTTSLLRLKLVTASSRAELRAMPLSKLKSHIKAYGISLGSAVEKDDLVDAIQLAKVFGA